MPPPPLELVKQATFPVIDPVTIAPDDEIPPALELVFTVAETSVAPQARPVTVRSPEESTVIICGVFEFHDARLLRGISPGRSGRREQAGNHPARRRLRRAIRTEL